MKLAALAIFHIAICYNVLGQTDTSFASTDLSKMVTQKDIYMQKSRSYKITAFVFLGLGTACTVTGATMMGTAKPKNEWDLIPKKSMDGVGLFFLGVLVDLGSIPFFTASSRNKQKAMLLSFKNESIPKEMVAYTKHYSIPSFSVKWKF
jgi:hypothetical protein